MCQKVPYEKVKKPWPSIISIIDPKSLSRTNQYNYILNIAATRNTISFFSIVCVELES
jgi:hypothetical protein